MFISEDNMSFVRQGARRFLGPHLATTYLPSFFSNSGSYALGNVHREVELDLYENYAAYVIDVINNQLIPAIIELNWGKSDELPFLEVELDRAEKDKQLVERDKLLFQEMGLPVSKQWLYDRHKVPAPGPSEDLFNSNPSGGTTSVSSAASAPHRPEPVEGG